MHDFIESRTVYHAVFADGETGGTPRLHGNRIAVLELTHIELAGGGTAFGLAVGRTVDIQRTHTADAFAAIVVEYERLLALLYQLFIQNVQHLQE